MTRPYSTLSYGRSIAYRKTDVRKDDGGQGLLHFREIVCVDVLRHQQAMEVSEAASPAVMAAVSGREWRWSVAESRFW
jgi:hypothetical protein